MLKKPQDEVIAKLDAHLRFKKKQKKQINYAKDIIRKKTLMCSEKIPVARKNMLTKILISSKYKNLSNSDIWGNNVLPELNISSQIVDSNILATYYKKIIY